MVVSRMRPALAKVRAELIATSSVRGFACPHDALSASDAGRVSGGLSAIGSGCLSQGPDSRSEARSASLAVNPGRCFKS